MSRSRFRYIMGRNCIREVLKHSPERLVEVFTSTNKDPLVNELLAQGINLVSKQKHHLSKMVQSESHQGFIASIKEKHQMGVKEFLKISEDKSSSCVVMLDSIYDPQNLGAILRASECFGVDLVLFSKNRGADITPVVSKASVGASELLEIVKVSNLADTLKQFQEAGYWSVCADGGEESVSMRDFFFPEKMILIMGSEGEGIQPLLKKRADHKVRIPMEGELDCLNVSQATSVFLYAWSTATVST